MTVRTAITAVFAGVPGVLLAVLPGAALTTAGAAPPSTPLTVRAIVSTAVLPVGHTVLVRGRVAPKSSKGKVTLQELDGVTWRPIEQEQLSKSSTFLMQWTPTTAGVYVLRVVTPARTRHTPKGVSNLLSVVATGLTLPVRSPGPTRP